MWKKSGGRSLLGIQRPDLIDFKAAIINIFEEQKQTICKEAKNAIITIK